MGNMDRNCVAPIPIIHPVGISDGISFVLVVAAVSLFGSDPFGQSFSQSGTNSFGQSVCQSAIASVNQDLSLPISQASSPACSRPVRQSARTPASQKRNALRWPPIQSVRKPVSQSVSWLAKQPTPPQYQKSLGPNSENTKRRRNQLPCFRFPIRVAPLGG